MFKKLKKTILLSSLFLSVAGLAAAPVKAQEHSERKGFLIGLYPFFGGETNLFERAGGGVGLRIGGGFNEKFLLYYDGNVFLTGRDGATLSLTTHQAVAQYFFYNNFYGNLGLGFSHINVSDDTDFGTVSVKSDVGFGMSAGLGYEFRITKRFVVAPEVSFGYHRIEGENLFSPQARAYLGWYF